MTAVLLDADGLVYRLAYRNQGTVDWDGDGDLMSWTNPEVAKAQLDEYVDELRDDLGADRVVMCLSDPDTNWRHTVMPAYKANRAPEARPELWAPIRRYITDQYETWLRPGLEADDVMGILATNPKIIQDSEKIIATIDKDLKQVPGLFYDLGHPEDGVQQIDPVEAEKWHLKQALAGDPVDNYFGAQGVGWETADALIEAHYAGEGWQMWSYQHEFKRGARKGQTEIRWRKVPSTNVWIAILSYYRKARHPIRDALRNAIVARILRHGEYDYANKQPIYWDHERIQE